MEASPGIEPGYTDLQSAASPLRHEAIETRKKAGGSGDVTEHVLTGNECVQVEAATDCCANWFGQPCILARLTRLLVRGEQGSGHADYACLARLHRWGSVMDFAAARDTMIESQVRTNDVSDLALQSAMRKVAREAFVIPEKREFAYAEVEIPTPSGRLLWKPRDFAKVAQAGRVLAGERVLVIGGGAGYSAAVFAALGCAVTLLDEVPTDIAGVTCVTGKLTNPPAGPFDVVFVDGAVQTYPDSWTEVLSEGGRLCLVIHKGAVGVANILTKSGSTVAGRIVFDAFVPELPGFAAEPVFTF